MGAQRTLGRSLGAPTAVPSLIPSPAFAEALLRRVRGGWLSERRKRPIRACGSAATSSHGLLHHRAWVIVILGLGLVSSVLRTRPVGVALTTGPLLAFALAPGSQHRWACDQACTDVQPAAHPARVGLHEPVASFGQREALKDLLRAAAVLTLLEVIPEPHQFEVLQSCTMPPWLPVHELVELYAAYYPNPRSASETIDLVG